LKNEQKVLIFRHGATRYWQGNEPVDYEKAYDLAQGTDQLGETVYDRRACIAEAEQAVRGAALRALDFIDPGAFFEILSSPTGRCLHTARVVLGQISDHFASLATATFTPISEPGLTEVEGFQWKLFTPLARGGEITHGGETFSIDRAESNPEGLSPGDYFFGDRLHALGERVTSKWPSVYVQAIKQFERASSVRGRMKSVLRTLNPFRQSFLFTHDALTGFMVRAFTQGTSTELPRGGFLVLERRGTGLHVINVCGNAEGDDSVDVLGLD
jgi:broad specificity phosphatase PhoE